MKKPKKEEPWDAELKLTQAGVVKKAKAEQRDASLALQEYAIRKGIRSRLADRDAYAREDRQTAEWVYLRAMNAMRIAEALQRPGGQDRTEAALHYLLESPGEFQRQLGRAPPENILRRLAASFAEACRNGFNRDLAALTEESMLALMEAARATLDAPTMR